jgi:hypothetical protein
MNKVPLWGLLAAALVSAGCVHYAREDTSENRSVEQGAAREARVQIEMGAGELRIEPGSGKLLDADFHYSAVEWRPELKYDISAARGYLTVRQPPIRGFNTGNQENRWDLRLSDKIPLDLRVQLGAGEGTLRLSGMAVRRLEVNVGAGQLNLDLRGGWDENFEGTIRGGVGEAVVRLPREVGVRVRASGGIGGVEAEGLEKEGEYYINEAYGKSGVRVRLDISGGIGEIRLIG